MTDRKHQILTALRNARYFLAVGMVDEAQCYLANARQMMTLAPASTRRRWKCGK